MWVQLCTEEIWQGTMEQISKLGIRPAELPEEALTQIYQVHISTFLTYSRPSRRAHVPIHTALQRLESALGKS